MIYVILTYLFLPILYLLIAIRMRRFPSPAPLPEASGEGVGGRVLVIQTAKIGDMICSTPVFREIKKKYPEVNLSVIASPVTAELLKYNSNVDDIITLNTKNTKGISGKLELIKLLYNGKYDVSLSLNPNIPFTIAPLWALIPMRIVIMPNFCGTTLKIASGLNTHNVRHETGRLVLETYIEMLEVIDVKTKDVSKEVYKSPDADRKVLGLLNSKLDPESSSGRNSKLIGIAVSSGNKLKELGKEKITELANRLLENFDTCIVLIGSDADRTTADRILSSINRKDKVINTAGELSLTELPALIERLSLFTGVDTGITYMADALSVPLIDIAGPSDMSDQRPIGKNSLIIQKDILCVPCSHAFRSPYSCEKGDRICITSVSVSEIVEAAKKLLNPSFPQVVSGNPVLISGFRVKHGMTKSE
jgi:ADP-heptose:LPS heptosyltransferase